MMKNITMNLKHLVLTFTLAIFAVAANAVNVTYSLTTHVDNRTITGTANLNVGDNLENKMPTALWRGYTHYTFYKDANKTQAITTLESGVTTVYVDYVFDPPFQLSDDTKTVWNYFRNAPGTGYEQYLYYSQYKSPEKFYSQQDLKTGSMNLKIKENAQWALYGDAYSLSFKFNDKNNNEANDYMQPNKYRASFLAYYTPQIGAEVIPGWQLYENAYKPGFFSLVRPNSDEYLYIYDFASYLRFNSLNGKLSMNNQNVVYAPNNYDVGELLPFAFVVTPASSDEETMDFWHVTFKIQKEDGTMYPDYVMQKHSLNPEDLWPPTGFRLRDGYEYDRFYTDANFTQKLEGNMPDGCNTVLYIKETEANYVAEQWKTLVLPYSIDNLDDYFGTNGVRVLKYSSVQGQLNGDAFRCNLIFTPAYEIEAYKPYLFKADHVSETVLSGLRHTVEGMDEEEDGELKSKEIKLYYSDNPRERIGVAMKGVLKDGGITLPDDGLHFFFGSYPNREVENYEDYTYKFYRQGGVTIPRFVCYFYVSDERENPSAPIKASFDTESITGVSTIVADIKVQNSIYSLDGRKIDATSLDNLKRGIYIVNGRKVVK